jgi:hypothetical protein
MSQPSRVARFAAAAGVGVVTSIAMVVPSTAHEPAPEVGAGGGVDVGAARDEIELPPAETRRLVKAIQTGMIASIPPLPVEPGTGQGTPDVGAARDQVNLPPEEVKRLLNAIETGSITPTTATATPPDGPQISSGQGSLELVQIAAGALAGAVLLGGNAVLTARRRHSAHAANQQQCPTLLLSGTCDHLEM